MNISQNDEQGTMFIVVNLSYDILVGLSFITFVPAYILANSYFKSVSLDKECLLLHIHKDVITSLLLWRTFWLVEVIMRYWNKEGLNETQAMIVTFGLWFAAFYLALILIFISIYKLYMSKTKTVDPTIPWLGKEEAYAVTKIRCGCCLVVISFLAMTFGLESYPTIYYYIMVHGSLEEGSLMSNILYRGIVFLLLMVSGILTLARKFLGTKDLQVDQIIPKTIKYAFIISVFSLVVGTLMEYCQFSDNRIRLKIYQIVLSPIQICVPLLFILRSDQLKAHSIRFLKNKSDDLFMLNLYLVPLFFSIVIYSTLCVIQ